MGIPYCLQRVSFVAAHVGYKSKILDAVALKRSTSFTPRKIFFLQGKLQV